MTVKNETIKNTLIASLGAIFSVAISFYCNYKYIETPKIELEQKKNVLAALALIQEMKPRVTVSCLSKRTKEQNSWQLICSGKNIGTYSAMINISEIVIELDEDPAKNRYTGKELGFTVRYPHDQSAYVLAPGQEGGLTPYIEFDSQKYPPGFTFKKMNATIAFKFSTPEELINAVRRMFPDMEDVVNSQLLKGGINHAVSLN